MKLDTSVIERSSELWSRVTVKLIKALSSFNQHIFEKTAEQSLSQNQSKSVLLLKDCEIFQIKRIRNLSLKERFVL